MSVIQKKICMLGSFAVGKTSLVSRYVSSIFSETYTTTIGVKIDKKEINMGEKTLSLVLWDVYGEDNHQSIVPAYLRGLAGYILVVDPTRPSTVSSALKLHKMVEENLGTKPFVLAKNKADLKDQWEHGMEELEELVQLSAGSFETSAKTDTGVDELFETLASSLVTESQSSSK